MRYDIVNDDKIKIFINSIFFNIDINNKEEVIKFIKEFIKNNRYKLHLNGFYKIKVNISDKIGMFIEIIRLEEISLSSTLDLKVIIDYLDNVLLKFDDYFLFENKKGIMRYHNNYYIKLDNLDNLGIFDYCELGEYVYGNEALKIISLADKIR